jgi:hypothetical protein
MQGVQPPSSQTGVGCESGFGDALSIELRQQRASLSIDRFQGNSLLAASGPLMAGTSSSQTTLTADVRRGTH